MNAYLNTVRIVGDLESDPEIEVDPLGVRANYCNIGVITKGTKQFDTERHNVVFWGDLTKKLDGAKKDSRVSVIGRLQTISWYGAGKEERYRTDIIASKVDILCDWCPHCGNLLS